MYDRFARSSTVRSAACRAALSLALAGFALPADAEVKKPDCDALAEWAVGVDRKDRVQPVEGSHAWIPRAFTEPAFAELFGTPALDWTAKEAREVGAHVFQCGKVRKDRDQRNALYAARGYMISNLVGVLVQKERQAARAKGNAERAAQQKARAEARAKAQAAREAQIRAQRKAQAEAQAAQAQQRAANADAQLDKAVDDFLAEPDKLRLLRRLAWLRQIKPNDPRSYNQAAMHAGQAGNQLLYVLRIQHKDVNDPRVKPKLDERYAALQEGIVADYQARVDKLESNTDSLRFLDRWQGEVDRTLTPVLGKAQTAPIGQAIADKRQAIRGQIVDLARQSIDKAPEQSENDLVALNRIDRIVNNLAGAGIPRDQLEQVKAYAEERQGPIADRALAAQREALDDLPENLDGLNKVLLRMQRVTKGSLSRASDGAKQAYLAAARDRLNEIAEAALPQFEEGVAGVPENPQGLNMLDKTLVSAPGFGEVDESIGSKYREALEGRRQEIKGKLTTRSVERRREAVASGGDPDLVGHRFADSQNRMQIEFQDEKNVAFRLNGKVGIAGYKVEGDMIRVFPPGMPFVLTRSGSGDGIRLNGLGMVFQRIGD